MKHLAFPLSAALVIGFVGCASVDRGEQARFQPRPPYLLNALADTADTIADNAPGPLAYPPRVHATLFRALTPGFWLDRREASTAADWSQEDAKFLQEPS
jgi:hypothetical protein